MCHPFLKGEKGTECDSLVAVEGKRWLANVDGEARGLVLVLIRVNHGGGPLRAVLCVHGVPEAAFALHIHCFGLFGGLPASSSARCPASLPRE